MLQLCHDSGIPRVYSLLAFSGLWLIVLINTLFFLPKYKATPPGETKELEINDTLHESKICKRNVCDQENAEDSIVRNVVDDNDKTKSNRRTREEPETIAMEEGVDNDGFVKEGNIENDLRKTENLQVSQGSGDDVVKQDSLVQCVFSVMNITYLFWFACLHVTIQFFPATFNMRVTEIVNGDIEKGKTFYHFIPSNLFLMGRYRSFISKYI